MKPYRFALLLGRFQVLHNGHVDMIQRALALAERVVILIGSADESGTAKNPLTYAERAEVIRCVFGDAVETFPLKDIGVGNNAQWGEYVLDTVESAFHTLPDLTVSGKENRRTAWYDNPRGLKIAELFVPKTVDISSTAMRQFLLEDNLNAWKAYTDPKIWGMYPLLKDAVMKAKGNTETNSI